MKNGNLGLQGKELLKADELGILAALVVLCTFLSLYSPFFLSVTNIMNVLRQFAIYAILATGQSMIIISGGLDLSVGTSMGLMGVLCAYMSTNLGMPAIAVFPITLVFGGLFGAFNGLLVTKVGMNPFITTLGTQNMARGLALLITGGTPIWLESKLVFIGGGYIGPVPFSVLVMLAVAAAFVVFTKQTVPGRNLYAVGSNERSARLSGIRPDRVKVMAYVIMGVLAALCGMILAGQLKSADPQGGAGNEMQAITAAIIGGTSLTGGKGSILGVLIGASLMGVLRNGLVLLSLPSYWQIISVGAVILLAVAYDSFKAKREAK
jgi:ribose transport system permease protein